MKHPTLILLALALSAHAEITDLEIATPEPGRLEVRRGTQGATLVTHVFTGTHSRPYIHPLRSPDGKGILTEFSPGHHKHQTGLYWGQTRINGRDFFHHYDSTYWTNTKLTPLPATNGASASWKSSSELLGADGKPVLHETQTWSLFDRGSSYNLDLTWKAEALTDVTIGNYNYGGLFLRMPWTPGTPAAVINSEDQQNQAGEGQPARWVDLAMEIKGMDAMAHVVMIDHPQNPGHPNLWRIDRQFGIGPAIARRGDLAIPKGDSIQYRFRLVVYQGDFDAALVEREQAAFAKP